jgi:type II secretory pathway pseudopilin PulG
MKKNKTSGFTLLETIIYVSILCLFIMILTQTFTTILDAQLESQATSSVEEDGNYILTRLNYDIRRAENVTIPANLGDQNTSLQMTVGGINYTYNLNNGNLLLTDNSGTNQLNSSETTISNLKFTKLGNIGGKSSIQITITVSSVTLVGTNREIRNYQTTAGLR